MARSRRCHGLIVNVGVLVVAGAVATCSKPYVTVQSVKFDTSRVAMAERENDTLATQPKYLGGPLGMPEVTTFRHRQTPTLTAEITTLSEGDLRKYLSKLVYHTDVYSTEVAYLPCVDSTAAGDVPCTGQDSAVVYIQPDIGMDKWKHDDIPAAGLIVARVINYSASARHEAKFGFGGSRHTWWVVDKDGSGHYRSRFVERTYKPGAALRVLNAKEWPFGQCMHRDVKTGRPARAKFWNCDRSREDVASLMVPRNEVRTASYFRTAAYEPFTLPARPRPYATSDTWVTCAEGCCIAGP
ncbi:MAG: hypothetical protein HOQ09_15080 [Gemmatimonadaceae bacterium]|nr:hypothetical protein [Gemmatimonadaceae bacterium]